MHQEPTETSDQPPARQHTYNVHKIQKSLVTESVGEGADRTWVQVLYTVEADLAVTIDLDLLARILTEKALPSKNGTARLHNGAILATAYNITRTQKQVRPTPQKQ
jgi:hypothetical protein